MWELPDTSRRLGWKHTNTYEKPFQKRTIRFLTKQKGNGEFAKIKSLEAIIENHAGRTRRQLE